MAVARHEPSNLRRHWRKELVLAVLFGTKFRTFAAMGKAAHDNVTTDDARGATDTEKDAAPGDAMRDAATADEGPMALRT